MTDYLMLIIFPSKTLDKLNDKRPRLIILYLIFTVTMLIVTLPKYIAGSFNNPEGLEALTLYLMVSPFVYFPYTYGFGYLFWIISKGFKGVSTFAEMRILMVYTTLPFIINAIIAIPFIATGISRNNGSIIMHDNYLTNLILWLLSFRIMLSGIAKYNKFNWMITLITYFITVSIFGGMVYLLQQLRQ